MNKTKIKQLLSKYPKLNFIQKCVRHINNKDYVNSVLKMDTDPSIVKLETLGNSNEDKYICLIENYEKFAGFFALYRWVLDGLYFAERFNLTPVINYTNCLYADKENVNGTNNPFEYYFEKVSDISVEEAYTSHNVIRSKPINLLLAEELNINQGGGYRISDEYVNSMGKIAKRYIKLNSIVNLQIMNDVNKILNGKKTIGVHVRGTDFKLKCNNHPVVVEPTEFIGYVKEVMLKHGYEQIFLATDELDTINLFKNIFADKLVYFEDVFRTNGNSVVLSASERMNHKYLLGLEVLRDMITLANCDGLIAGMSQVSVCARITKASNGEKYDYLKIIDKGIYNNKKSPSDSSIYYHKNGYGKEAK